MKSRNFTINGKRTSMRIEPEFLSALNDICHRENITAQEFLSKLSGANRSSVLRVAIMEYYMRVANLPPVDLRGEPV